MARKTSDELPRIQRYEKDHHEYIYIELSESEREAIIGYERINREQLEKEIREIKMERTKAYAEHEKMKEISRVLKENIKKNGQRLVESLKTQLLQYEKI